MNFHRLSSIAFALPLVLSSCTSAAPADPVADAEGADTSDATTPVPDTGNADTGSEIDSATAKDDADATTDASSADATADSTADTSDSTTDASASDAVGSDASDSTTDASASDAVGNDASDSSDSSTDAGASDAVATDASDSTADASDAVGISATATTTAQNLVVGTAMASFSPLTPSGGAPPYSYGFTGVLPAGLNFDASTGVVTGTPSAVYATASLVFSVQDANHVVASTTSTVSFTVVAAAVVASNLNDTGITANQCLEGPGVDLIVSCSSASALSLSDTQDGMIGRDAQSATNGNADGKLGFSFTRVPASGGDPGDCVLDNVSGLMWEVKTTGGLRDWINSYTNVNPAYDPSKRYGTATDASGYIAAVNATNLCGHNDWRLPAADELQGIVNYGVAGPGPAIDTTWFPNTSRGGTWTSSPWGGAVYTNRFVDFSEGIVNGALTSAAYSVRLVRGGRAPVTPRFTVSGDGQEVTDNQTRLVWRRCVEGMAYSGGTCTGTASSLLRAPAFQRAASQASSTGLAWRLPNVKELGSIVDLGVTAFPAAPTDFFWTGSTSVGYSTHAWVVSLPNGYVLGSAGNSNSQYRLVRLVRAGA